MEKHKRLIKEATAKGWSGFFIDNQGRLWGRSNISPSPKLVPTFKKNYEEWLEWENGGIEQSIADAESGADREHCYDSEASMEKAYQEYVENYAPFGEK